ncbi:hypothetical protein PUN28_017052 [Cardiocondyla obscurior]|uniref:Uncharacterized protein n=1 Tax=Cardiocondyla obscurior TaxID=286306 RepID=A0AAW2ELQ0_9HYME
MTQREKLRELFGSLSEGSDSPPASPPPGTWPPPVDPSLRYPVPRVGTSIQQGDSSQQRRTRWLEEPPPALPKTSRRARGPFRPTEVPAAKTAVNVPATGQPGKGPGSSKKTPKPGTQPADATKAAAMPGRSNTSSGQGRKMATEPPRGEARAMASRQRERLPKVPPAPTKVLTIRSRGPPPPAGPTIREMRTIRPPRSEVVDIAGIENITAARDQPRPSCPATRPGTSSRTVEHGTRPAEPTITSVPPTPAPAVLPADPREVPATSVSPTFGKTTGPTSTGMSAVLAMPLPPFAIGLLQPTAPPAAPPPTPPAYVREKGWAARPGVPLAVPIQLPDKEYTSVPMSAIRQNRKWRARTSTGRWLLRFAPDGRLSLLRKLPEDASD